MVSMYWGLDIIFYLLADLLIWTVTVAYLWIPYHIS